MGRRPGNPEDQAAMGHPCKRKTKTEKAIAEAERQAKLLALPRAEEASDAPPAYLEDIRLAPALAVWREYAPRLDKLHLLARLDRHTFALFCVYAGEFVVACEDILLKGYSVKVNTVSGDHMPRENPSVSRRDFAAKIVEACFANTASDNGEAVALDGG
jgi:phage terminase small subunit